MNQEQTILETIKHRDKVSQFLEIVIDELLNRSCVHDASKLVEPELSIFTEFTNKLANVTYGSETYNKYLKDMKPALDHHYAVNRHHPEHFSNGIQGMNLIDLIEMICDWKAATLRHNDGNILRSIDINAARFLMTPELTQILRNTVELFESQLEKRI